MTTEIKLIGTVPMAHPRVEYFAGQFLEEKDFQAEQEYHLMRRRRLNRELFSHGVRRGFAVKTEGPEHKALRVGSGAAMDYLGRELWLEKDQLLEVNPPEDGEYFLYMQVLEEPGVKIRYSGQAPQTDAGPAAGSTSPWEGNTRNTETIEFSFIGTARACAQAHIKLARVQWKDGCFSSVEDKDRHLSTASLGSGLTVHPSGHYIDMYYEGKLNAYIGADMERQGLESVTFCSTSRRMHLSGDEDLYLLHKKGVVIAKSWYGDIAESGSLTVQGATTLEGSLTVRSATTLQGGLSITRKSDEADGGKLTVQGAATLQGGLSITRRDDEADGGKLTVQGAATLQGGLNVVRDVVIEKDPGKKGGNLTVQGMATVKESLNVHQNVVIDGSLQVKDDINVSSKVERGVRVTGGALKDQGLSIAGAEFTYHPGDDKKKFPGMKLFSKERMHISGDEELFLLHKKGVVIGKSWYPDSTQSPDSGCLEVHGKTTFRDFVVHAPGAHNNRGDTLQKIKDKLVNEGDFLFFVETVGPGDGKLLAYWRAKEGIRHHIMG